MLRTQPSPAARVKLAVALVLGVLIATLTTASPSLAAAPSEPTGPVVEWPDPATAILSWSPSPEATRYNIEIADNVGFTGAIKDTTASTTYVPTAKLKPGTWYWHVQAVNASKKPPAGRSPTSRSARWRPRS